MASSSIELPEELLVAVQKLSPPPQSAEELITVLDEINSYLRNIEQLPLGSKIPDKRAASLKALVSQPLLRHPVVDVRVSLAYCLGEVVRFAAPEGPFDDDIMKDVFLLTVSSLEGIHDKSSQLYSKRLSILLNLSKTHSFLMMLDLGCDALILEMFRTFLKNIRDYHPESVLAQMANIMKLTLQESEEIPPALVSTLLDSLKSEEVSPRARGLVENVIKRCKRKTRGALVQVANSLGISGDGCPQLIASIGQEKCAAAADKEVHASSEQLEPPKPAKEVERTENEMKESKADMLCPVVKSDEYPEEKKEVKSCFGNSSPGGEEERKKESFEMAVQSADHVKAGEFPEVEKEVESLPGCSSPKLNQNEDVKMESKRRESQATGLIPEVDKGEIYAEVEKQERCLQNSSPAEAESRKKSIKMAVMSADIESQESPEAAKEVESCIVISSSGEEEEKKESLNMVLLSSDAESQELPETAKEVESFPVNSSPMVASKNASLKMASFSADDSRSSHEPTKKSEGITYQYTSENVPIGKPNAAVEIEEPSKIDVTESSDKRDKEVKKRGQRKAANKEITQSAVKDDQKEAGSLMKSTQKSSQAEDEHKETPRRSSREKRTTIAYTIPDVKEYREDMVGSRVKVYWPRDDEFYDGVVVSFDSRKKKHKLMYDDGQEEIIDLEVESWVLLENESESARAEASQPSKKKAKTASGSSGTPKNSEGSGSQAKRKGKGRK